VPLDSWTISEPLLYLWFIEWLRIPCTFATEELSLTTYYPWKYIIIEITYIDILLLRVLESASIYVWSCIACRFPIFDTDGQYFNYSSVATTFIAATQPTFDLTKLQIAYDFKSLMGNCVGDALRGETGTDGQYRGVFVCTWWLEWRGRGCERVITLPGGKAVRGKRNRKEADVKGLDVADAEGWSGWMESLWRDGWRELKGMGAEWDIHLNCPWAVFVPSNANII